MCQGDYGSNSGGSRQTQDRGGGRGSEWQSIRLPRASKGD